MSLVELSASDKQFVDDWAFEVKNRSKKILDVLEALQTDLTSTDLIEQGLTKLILILKQLPNDLLNEKEVGLLLEFLIGKLEASALKSGCVVIGVHHLVINSKNLPESCEVPIFQSIYGESTVQCFSVSDRVLLFEILEFFLKERLSGLKQLGSVFVYSFMRAVNGERDPRCLFQVFQLFLEVVKNFDLGIYCEDFFELVAAYFPLQYIPTENQVSKETLSTLLESCLLSHNSFSFFCFSLVADRLSDAAENADEVFDILNFLTKAAQTFNSEPMRSFIDDYLTAFRRITLDPTEKSGRQIPQSVKCAIIAIIKAFDNDTEMLKQIANTMVENVEPFVLQAEMGLTGKALDLLSVVANAHKVAADVVLPQTMYWIGNLIHADTVNAPQNRREIVVEAIHFVPQWLKLSLECACLQIANDCLPGFIEGLKLAEERYGSDVYQSEYQLATVILHHKETFTPYVHDVEELFKKLVWRAATDLKLPEKSLKLAIHDFIVTFSLVEFDSMVHLLEKNDRSIDDSVVELYSLSINDDVSFDKLGIVLLNYVKTGSMNKEVSQSIVQVFERNKGKNTVNDRLIDNILCIITENDFIKNLNGESQNIFAEMLQQAFRNFSINKIDEFCGRIIKAFDDSKKILGFTYLALIQTDNISILNDLFFKSSFSPEHQKFIHFARVLNGWNGEIDSNPSLRVVQNKAHLLLRAPRAIAEMESLLEEFLSTSTPENWKLVDLFDFEHPAFNPEQNSFKVSILWRQRISCQTIPVFIKYFSKISKTDEVRRSIYLEALSPILASANKIKVSIAADLMALFPVLTEALQSFNQTKNNVVLDLILSGLIQLLQQTTMEEIPQNDLKSTSSNIQKIIDDGHQSVAITLKCLNILEIVGKTGKTEILLPSYSLIVKCLVKATQSKKRLIRQKAAVVRNLWELTVA